MASALDTLRQQYQQRDIAARKWKDAGGRVVGYLCDNVPDELIIAAGCLAYRLSGDPTVSGTAVDRYVHPFAAPFSARNQRPQFVGSMLELVLEGRYDFLDALVVPRTRTSIQALYRELTLARAAEPTLRLPELVYLDRAHTPDDASELFNRERLVEFKTWLEAWSGVRISPAALAEAVAETNRTRTLLRRLAELRRGRPPCIAGADALAVIGPSTFMPKPEYNVLLEQFLAAAGGGVPLADNLRVFIGGSPQDHPLLYEVIEACGATIVAEDHCWGHRLGDFPLDSSLDPFEAVAARYHHKPACSIAFPLATTVDTCTARALEAGADAAIFFVERADTGHIWDTPDEIDALQAHGIPSLYLSNQPYAVADTEALGQTVRRFFEAVLAGGHG